MEIDETTHENIFKLMVLFTRVAKKYSEFEKMSLDIGTGEKLYPSELHMIMAIGKNRVNVTELSKKFGITKGAVSQVVNKLHEKGFVNKERNKDYGKEIILSLTEKGWMVFKIQDNLHKKMDIEFIKYLEAVTPEQMDSFVQIMGKIENLLDTFLRNEL